MKIKDRLSPKDNVLNSKKLMEQLKKEGINRSDVEAMSTTQICKLAHTMKEKGYK